MSVGVGEDLATAAVRPLRGRSRIRETIFVAALAFVSSIALLLFRHVQPLADDFYRMDELKRMGLFAAMHKEYLGYSGRWAAEVIQVLDARYGAETRLYALPLLPIALVMVVAVYRLVGAVAEGAPRHVVAAVAVGLLCLYWSRMPGPGETFYWLPGAAEDQFGLSLYLLVLAALLRASSSGKAPGLGEKILLMMAVIVACGTHELYAIFFGVVACAGAFLAFADGDETRGAWLLVVAAWAAGFAIVYASPGNNIREASMPNHGNIQLALKVAFEQGKGYLVWWSQNFALWIGTILFLAHPAIQAIQPTWARAWLTRWWWVPVAAWLAILLGGFMGPSWAMGWEMPLRTANAIYLCFLIGWMFNAFLITRQGAPLGPAHLNWPRLRPWLLVGFALTLVTGPNVPSGFLDAVHRSGQFALDVRRREQFLNDAGQRGELDVEVPPIRVWPASYVHPMVGELNKSPDYWVNKCVARYYGLRSIRLQSSGQKGEVDKSS